MPEYEATAIWLEVPVDGEPHHLDGEATVTIMDADGREEKVIHLRTTGAPATFDAQLDAALEENGWRRTSVTNSSWSTLGVETTNAAGKFKVERA